MKYTLRALAANLPHDGVVVAGDALPRWAVGIESQVYPRQSNRFEDSQRSILEALATVKGWAYIMHDDMVISRPVDWIGPAHRGPMSLYRRHGNYYDRARQVAGWMIRYGVKQPLNYNVHAPFLVNAEKYLEAAELVAHLPAGFRASVYGNLNRIPAPRVHDPKVVNIGQKPHPAWPVWSSSDRSFERGYVGKTIRRLFPHPGPYDDIDSD